MREFVAKLREAKKGDKISKGIGAKTSEGMGDKIS